MLVAERFDWIAVHAPNDPLADKHNAGTLALEGMDVDGVVVVNSDTFMSGAFIRTLVHHTPMSDYLTVDRIYFYDLPSQRAMLTRAPRIGAGRWISRSALERSDWMPWMPGWSKRMDAAQSKRLEALGITLDAWSPSDVMVDVKTPVNLWSYDSLRDGSVEVDARQIWNEENFPSWLNEWMYG